VGKVIEVLSNFVIENSKNSKLSFLGKLGHGYFLVFLKNA
jgi:hypothetical protein